jgi:hypothetical protein
MKQLQLLVTVQLVTFLHFLLTVFIFYFQPTFICLSSFDLLLFTDKQHSYPLDNEILYEYPYGLVNLHVQIVQFRTKTNFSDFIYQYLDSF